MAFIDIKKLSKRYTSEADCVEALREVTVHVKEGSFLGVMGPSGSGKSTLLAILGGLCHPTEGSVLVDEIDIFALSGDRLADFRREYLGFIFQSHNLVPYLTALENVMVPLAVKKLAASEKKEMAFQALARVGLNHRCGHLPNQLSGGEQERVAIARAIVNRPPLLLADEPTGSLDSGTSEDIMGLLRELNDNGQTVVMVTHNSENCRYFNRTLLLRDGQVEAVREAPSVIGEAV